MKLAWSMVTFVPDAARGEQVNVGILAGSDATGWRMRVARHTPGAAALDHADRPCWPGVRAWLDRLAAEVATGKLDEAPLDEGSLRVRARSWQGVVRLTPPLPVLADGPDHAMQLLWPLVAMARPCYPWPGCRCPCCMAAREMERPEPGRTDLHLACSCTQLAPDDTRCTCNFCGLAMERARG